MKQSRWSPADLDRQRLVVRQIALRTESDRRQLEAARQRLVVDVRTALGGPLALFVCFVAGVVIAPRAHKRAPAAAGVLKTLSLGAPAYSAFYRWLVTSPQANTPQRGSAAR